MQRDARPGTGRAPDLLERVGALGSAILGMLQTRLELAGTELALERDALIERAASTLVCAIAGGLAGFSAILLAALALPERWRLPALGGLVVAFTAVAIGAWLRGRRRAAARSSLLTRLVRQLRRDRAVLAAVGTASPPADPAR